MRLTRICGLVCVATATVVSAAGNGARKPAPKKVISEVSIAPSFFNPSLGQNEEIRFKVTTPGQVSLSILDRDRFVIRALSPRRAEAGPVSFKWDGKDDQGEVVPDESYSVRIQVHAVSGPTSTYDPSRDHRPIAENPPNRIYSRTDGILAYSLSRPSRVHVEAAEAVKNVKTGKWEGPILKTIVDRKPRVAGSISERWNGFDESGTIYVPDLKNFVVAVLATSLPENSIITVGNRKLTFVEYAQSHRPAGALRPRILNASHQHHEGLNALEDRSATLALNPSGSWDPTRRVWRADSTLTIKAELAKPFDAFVEKPATLLVFVDGKETRHLKRPSNPQELSIELTPGLHRVAFNWVSGFGPVAVNSIRVLAAESSQGAGSAKPESLGSKVRGRS